MGNGLLLNNMDVSLLTRPNSSKREIIYFSLFYPCMASSHNLFVMVHLDNYEGLSSIHGANYMPEFQKDSPIYNDVPGSGIGSQKLLGLGSWEEILEQSSRGCHTLPSPISLSSTEPVYAGVGLEQQTVTLSNLPAGESSDEKQLESSLPVHSSWQVLTVSVSNVSFSLHNFLVLALI